MTGSRILSRERERARPRQAEPASSSLRPGSVIGFRAHTATSRHAGRSTRAASTQPSSGGNPWGLSSRGTRCHLLDQLAGICSRNTAHTQNQPPEEVGHDVFASVQQRRYPVSLRQRQLFQSGSRPESVRLWGGILISLTLRLSEINGVGQGTARKKERRED